jgi:carbonic anhydrase/acetyltransferase-like protein (isoleucine patch superfamily)
VFWEIQALRAYDGLALHLKIVRPQPNPVHLAGMSLDEQFATFLAKEPTIDPTAYVAPGVTLIGDVRFGPRVSVWPGCVLRGDINFIEIGEATNVQDGTIIHLADKYPVRIGRYVTIGHAAMIHACTIEDECLIGMRATILDGAVIGHHSIIGAGALVTQGTIIPPGSLVLGMPGKITRTLEPREQSDIRKWAEKYVKVAAAHRARSP